MDPVQNNETQRISAAWGNHFLWRKVTEVPLSDTKNKIPSTLHFLPALLTAVDRSPWCLHFLKLPLKLMVSFSPGICSFYQTQSANSRSRWQNASPTIMKLSRTDFSQMKACKREAVSSPGGDLELETMGLLVGIQSFLQVYQQQELCST